MTNAAKLAAAVLALASLPAGAVERIPGWRSDFVACTNEAIQANIPLVLVWGNKFCQHCANLEEDLQSADFLKWKSGKEYIFCFVEGIGINGIDPDYAPGARTFAGTAGGEKKTTPGSFPYVTTYWKKADGGVSAARFSTESSLTVAKAAERCFAGWEPPSVIDAFSFPVSGTAYDRLEAESSTKFVDVPVVRAPGASTTTNLLIATWPGEIVPAATNALVWSPGETQKLVRISLERDGKTFPQDKTMALSMTDSKGAKAAESAVFFVADAPVSVENPKFSEEEFDFGEWTMDYEAAKAKGGFVLAYFGGVLWCPYCRGIDKTLFDSGEFKRWATEKRVSLVLFDQGRASTPATASGDGTARLLSYAAGNSSPLGGAASGAAYLSRKSISPAAATERIAATTRFTKEWLPQESTAARLGNPTLLLVKNDKVVGRFAAARDEDKNYDPEENIARLDDLLALASRDGEENDHPSTTKRTIPADDGLETAVWQINDKTECFALTGAAEGVLTATATAPRDILLEVLSNGETLASGVNSLTADIERAHLDSGRLVVRTTAVIPAATGPSGSIISGDISTSFAPDADGGDDSGGVRTRIETDKPTIAYSGVTINLWKGFAAGGTIELANIGNGKIAKRIASGNLPPGITLGYDATTKCIKIEGVAKSEGEYRVAIALAETVGGIRTAGEPVEIAFSVLSPATANPQLARARPVQTMILYAGTPEGDVPAGKLQFAFSSTCKIRAIYAGTGTGTQKFQGRWQTMDAGDGTTGATLESTGGTTLEISMDAGGTVAARASVPPESCLFAGDNPERTVLEGAIGPAEIGVFDAFAGNYTVQLPVATPDAAAINSGSACMTLSMTSLSMVKAGRMRYSLLLPDGRSTSGYAALERFTEIDEDGIAREYALLPVFARSQKAVFGACLRIASGAAASWTPPVESINLPAVEIAEGTAAYSTARDKILGAETVFHEAYGSYFKSGLSPATLCSLFSLGEELRVSAGIEDFESERYGKVVQWPEAVLSTAGGDFSTIDANAPLKGKYSPASGVIKFKSGIVFENGKRTALLAAVAMPGWTDCHCSEGFVERPFAAGTIFFKDYVKTESGWRAVMRSAPVSIEAAR